MGLAVSARRLARMASRMAAPPAAFVLWLLGGVCAPSPGPAMAADGAAALHATLANGVVLGSAFYIDHDVVATNAHVVAGLSPGAVVTLSAGPAPQRSVSARLLAVSARMDLAILRAPAGFLPVAPRRKTSAVVATPVSAAGVRVSAAAPQGRPARAHGRIAAVPVASARFGEGLVAAMTGVGPGFSGGPAVDGAGRLVGMVTAVRRGGRETPAGSAFAPLFPRVLSDSADAFILGADALRDEARRLLAEIGS